jgi:RNA polymerase sigma factor (sigma-70 family)
MSPMSSCSGMSNGVELSESLHPLSDDVLVVAARSGEEWAFVELCARNSQRVFSMIYRVTKNREDAEDALQSSIVRALLHLEQFDGRSSFATWFTRIGINSALMILRQKRFRLESSIDSTPEEESWHPLQIADYAPNPEERYAAYERSTHLKRAICQLPPALRSVVELAKMEGHSIKQIAHQMGISVPATKSRLGRAKAALRKSMT